MKRILPLLLATFVVSGLGACNESLESGAACPSLCPAQTVPVRDTLISPALVFDSTFVGFPVRGTESGMLLATRGDTLEVRGVIRFDTLIYTWTPTNDTSRAISKVDGSLVRLRLNLVGARIPDSVRFDVFDVDTTADDSSSAAVLALYRPDRRIGSRSMVKSSLTDSLDIPLSDSAVLSKLKVRGRLRLGFRVAGSGSVSLRAQTVETGLPAVVWYHPTSADTAIKAISSSPTSATPADSANPIFPELRSDLVDYQLVAKNAMPPCVNGMAIGGVPGRRAYLRFNLPQRITDSSTIVRATLELTQVPQRFGDSGDTVNVWPQMVLASPRVTDLRTASQLIASPGVYITDSLRFAPGDSGVKTLELNALVRQWASQSARTEPPPRALVLRASPEAVLPGQVCFSGSSGPSSSRPRLRLSWVPRIVYGMP